MGRDGTGARSWGTPPPCHGSRNGRPQFSGHFGLQGLFIKPRDSLGMVPIYGVGEPVPPGQVGDVHTSTEHDLEAKHSTIFGTVTSVEPETASTVAEPECVASRDPLGTEGRIIVILFSG